MHSCYEPPPSLDDMSNDDDRKYESAYECRFVELGENHMPPSNNGDIY
jgi:hypothetical protein